MPWTLDDMPTLDGKTAIVTGANSGLGLETARALARRGAHVVLACRSPERGAEALQAVAADAPTGSAELMALDLGDLASVRAFATAFLARHERLDLLVNNAGVMVPPEGRTTDGFELQFGINHLGHFALTGLLLDRLISTGDARVVTVSSVAHRGGRIDFDNLNAEKGYRAQTAYGQSKLANLLFTKELQRRLEGTGVLALASHPGFSSTNLMRTMAMGRFMAWFMASGPTEGAAPSLFAATAPDVEPGGYYGPTGWFEIRGAPGPAHAAAQAQDDAVARRLWALSEEMTHVSYAAHAA
jgi:NAD(P)-dependent dehydrogenase (short-subunit alcohol dehydrogenase family)